MTPAFQWIASGVETPALDYAQLEQWIARVAEAHGRQALSLNYIFCDDKGTGEREIMERHENEALALLGTII